MLTQDGGGLAALFAPSGANKERRAALADSLADMCSLTPDSRCRAGAHLRGGGRDSGVDGRAAFAALATRCVLFDQRAVPCAGTGPQKQQELERCGLNGDSVAPYSDCVTALWRELLVCRPKTY